MQAVNFPKGHEQQVMVAEADHFGQRHTLVASRTNPADFADGGEGSFGFNHQSGQLNDAPAIFQDTEVFRPVGQAPETVRRSPSRLGDFNHAKSDCFKSSTLVSRWASTTPKRVFTRQPPRLTAGER